MKLGEVAVIYLVQHEVQHVKNNIPEYHHLFYYIPEKAISRKAKLRKFSVFKVSINVTVR